MKKIASFVLFCFFLSQSYSQNLVVNSGFESWQKINKPAGWTTALSCLKDSVVVNSGTYSCRHATTTDSKELGQVISVSSGSRYKITFWYKNDPATTGNGCRIWSNWKDADGNPISDDVSLPLLHSGYLKSETWKQYSAELTAPSNAASLNLILRTLPNSITYWDEIIFEESVPTGESGNCIKDLIIYPNPVSNILNISNMHNIQQIDIQTITGTVVFSRRISGENNITVPVSGFKDGIYIIRMYSKEYNYSVKIIKSSY